MFHKMNDKNSCNSDLKKNKTSDVKSENEDIIYGNNFHISVNGTKLIENQKYPYSLFEYPIMICWDASIFEKSTIYLFNTSTLNTYFFQINIPGDIIFEGNNIPVSLDDGTLVKYRKPDIKGKYTVILSSQRKKIDPDIVTTLHDLYEKNLISYEKYFSFFLS